MAVVSYMGYLRMVNCHKYLEKACLSLPIFHHGSNANITKKLLKYRNSLSSRLSLHWLRKYSVYPQLSNDSLGSRRRENQFNSVKYRFSHATPPDDKPAITLFTKNECPLCDVAKDKLEKYRTMCHIEHVYIDKDENSAWFEKYRYDIPVIHLDGKFLMKHKVFTDALEEAIENSLSRIKRKRTVEKTHHARKGWQNRESIKETSDLLAFYSGSFLDRCAHVRKDKEALDAKMREKTSRYVIFKSLHPLMIERKRNIKELRTLSFTEASIVLGSTADVVSSAVYLGSENEEVDWFALNLANDLDESLVKEVTKDSAEFTSAFFGMMRLNDMESSIAAQARGILAWHNSHQFCPECGSKSLMVDGGYRRKCTNGSCRTSKVDSHHACYPRVDPVTMALVLSPDHSKMLLGRKPMYPTGLFTCLAGYIEPGESFEVAVKREMLEECGLPVTNVRYVLSQYWPFPSTIMFGCMATAEHMDIQIDDEELEEVSWFDKHEAVRLISRDRAKAFAAGERVQIAPGKYALAHHLIKRWVNEYD